MGIILCDLICNPKTYMESAKIDDRIKHILEKDLGEEDLDTSLSYRAETNEKDYQEIFSNNVEEKVASNEKDKDSSKSKRKFFNNYLNF